MRSATDGGPGRDNMLRRSTTARSPRGWRRAPPCRSRQTQSRGSARGPRAHPGRRPPTCRRDRPGAAAGSRPRVGVGSPLGRAWLEGSWPSSDRCRADGRRGRQRESGAVRVVSRSPPMQKTLQTCCRASPAENTPSAGLPADYRRIAGGPVTDVRRSPWNCSGNGAAGGTRIACCRPAFAPQDGRRRFGAAGSAFAPTAQRGELWRML